MELNAVHVIGLSFGGVIMLLMATMIDREIREGKKSKSFMNRRFSLTGLELFCYALFLFLGVCVGTMMVFAVFSTGNWIWILVAIIAGFLCSADFFLLLNHIFYELFQQVSMNYRSGILSTKRFGKVVTIKLDDPDTMLIRYVPLWAKSYGTRQFKLFGARFSKMVIVNGKSRIQLSSLRKKSFNFSTRISSKNIRVVKRQVNFLY